MTFIKLPKLRLERDADVDDGGWRMKCFTLTMINIFYVTICIHNSLNVSPDPEDCSVLSLSSNHQFVQYHTVFIHFIHYQEIKRNFSF